MNRRIYTYNEWSLLPSFAFASCIAPGYFTGNGVPFPKFPEVLTKMQVNKKRYRMFYEVRNAVKTKMLCEQDMLVNSVLPMIFNHVMKFLHLGNTSEAAELLY